MKRQLIIICIFLFFLLSIVILLFSQKAIKPLLHKSFSGSIKPQSFISPSPHTPTNPLAITILQQKKYPGSQFSIEQTLDKTSTRQAYIVSYLSDGLKIDGLLTVPIGTKPKDGWPAILFNHGYIPPDQYSTINSYASYVDVFSRNGYIVFKPDYRGNAQSAGSPQQPYIDAGYIVDDLNALASLKQYPDVNKDKIGVWGHSMGGNITLHDLVITKDIKAAVIWGGVVGNYTELLQWWQKRFSAHIITGNDMQTYDTLLQMIQSNGDTQKNPAFWAALDPTNYLTVIQTPIQLHVGTNDQTVPPQFSQNLEQKLKEKGKTVQFYTYPGDDHNISQNFSFAMERSVAFFDSYLK